MVRRLLAVCAGLWLAGCGGLPAGGGASATQLDQAALLTASCTGCHASSGSAGGIASLEDISSAELQARLLAYREDAEGGSAMHRMARGYTDEQIAMIAGRLGN